MNMDQLFLYSLCEMVHSATWSLQCKTDKCINHEIPLPFINLCSLAPSGGRRSFYVRT